MFRGSSIIGVVVGAFERPSFLFRVGLCIGIGCWLTRSCHGRLIGVGLLTSVELRGRVCIGLHSFVEGLLIR